MGLAAYVVNVLLYTRALLALRRRVLSGLFPDDPANNELC